MLGLHFALHGCSHPMHGCGRGDVCSQQYCNIVALCLLSWSSRRFAQRSSSEFGWLLFAQNSIPARASLSVGGNARPSHPMHGCGRGDVCSQQYCNIVALCLLSWSSRRSAQPILLGVRKASLRSEQYSSESLSDSGRQCSASTFHI